MPSIISYGTIVLSFSNGTAKYDFTPHGVSKKPDALLFTLQSGLYLIQYNWDATTSPSSCVIYAQDRLGNSINGPVRVGFICCVF